MFEDSKRSNNVNYNEKLAKYGIQSANILLPKKGTDISRWAVVACDQYTSQPEYWESLKEEIGDKPSTLNIIYPEVYLESGDKDRIIESINAAMADYLAKDLFDEYKECFVLVKRDTESGTRYGLMAALDLEAYDYSVGSRTFIRATEGTILSRIPPRKEIRKNAGLEVPHIMVLISDKYRAIIEPLRDKKESLEKLYEAELLKNGGHLTGYLVNAEDDMKAIYDGFTALFNDLDPANPLLFAMGDGNHSLATAKSCWEDIKQGLSEEEKKSHPARFALVELENIFDEGLMFEPIHRVFFNLSRENFDNLLSATCASFSVEDAENADQMWAMINKPGQHFGITVDGKLYVYTVNEGVKNIAAGTIQLVIDKMLEEKLGEVDYIHGIDVTLEIGARKGNTGLVLPDLSKDHFFSDMLKDGAYPRKTFSIGHANEKRFYMEARKIVK